MIFFLVIDSIKYIDISEIKEALYVHLCAVTNKKLMSVWFLVGSLCEQNDMNMKTCPYMDFHLTLVLV